MHSRGVDHVTLDRLFMPDKSAPDSFVRWFWIMYALFHASSTHSVRSLKIWDANLLNFQSSRVSDFLKASQPLQTLFSKDGKPKATTNSTSTPSFGSSVKLADGTPIYLDLPHKSSEHLTASSSATLFQVILATKDMVSILVPAYGLCWVNKSNVVSVVSNSYEATPGAQWNLKAHAITQLEIRLHGDEYEAPSRVLSLLKLMGEPLKTLTIGFPSGTRFSESDFDKLWIYCPNLTELSLARADVPSLEVFIDAFQSGKCRLTSLELYSGHLTQDRNLRWFGQALGNPSGAVARILQQFRLQLEEYNGYMSDDDDDDDNTDEALASGFLKALKTNDQLSFLALDINRAIQEFQWQIPRSAQSATPNPIQARVSERRQAVRPRSTGADGHEHALTDLCDGWYTLATYNCAESRGYCLGEWLIGRSVAWLQVFHVE